ncbi:MAG: PD-(D/E)XK nuclease family protein, partial [Thermoanaerobaculia bacterium]
MQKIHRSSSQHGLRLRVKQLAEYIADTGPCSAAVRRAMEGPYERIPSDFDSLRWGIEHGAMVRRCADELRELGYAVYREDSNSFSVSLQRCGGVTLPAPVTLVGRPDIVAVGEDDVLVADAKTGKESPAHQVQVLLYQLLLPLAPRTPYVDRVRALPVLGQVVYKQHPSVDLPAAAVETAFRQLVAEAVVRLVMEADPLPEPSARACRFC